jgi:hypothetical protein
MADDVAQDTAETLEARYERWHADHLYDAANALWFQIHELDGPAGFRCSEDQP